MDPARLLTAAAAILLPLPTVLSREAERTPTMPSTIPLSSRQVANVRDFTADLDAGAVSLGWETFVHAFIGVDAARIEAAKEELVAMSDATWLEPYLYDTDTVDTVTRYAARYGVPAGIVGLINAAAAAARVVPALAAGVLHRARA